MTYLITDTETGEASVVEDLDEWLIVEKAEVGDLLEDADEIFDEVADGDWDLAASHLGYEIDQHPHLPDLSDRQWAAWFAHHLDRERTWTDDSVFITVDRRYDGEIVPGSWPKGMAIQVGGVHADRERSWRAIGSWEALRDAVEDAYDEEEAALKQIAHEREVEHRQWGPLRAAQTGVHQAENELARRERERDALLRQHVAEGVSIYKLSQITGMTQPRITRIVNRNEVM